MSKPICIDGYACASGSGVGYEMAGFKSYAIDNDPKMLKYNPLPHVCMDALEAVVLWLLQGFYRVTRVRPHEPANSGRVVAYICEACGVKQ